MQCGEHLPVAVAAPGSDSTAVSSAARAREPAFTTRPHTLSSGEHIVTSVSSLTGRVSWLQRMCVFVCVCVHVRTSVYLHTYVNPVYIRLVVYAHHYVSLYPALLVTALLERQLPPAGTLLPLAGRTRLHDEAIVITALPALLKSLLCPASQPYVNAFTPVWDRLCTLVTHQLPASSKHLSGSPRLQKEDTVPGRCSFLFTCMMHAPLPLPLSDHIQVGLVTSR